MKKTKFLLLLLPLIAGIVFAGIFSRDIINYLGAQSFSFMMTGLGISIFVVSFLPFLKVLRGGGYNFFWGKSAAAGKVLQNGRQAVAVVKSLGNQSGGMQMRINRQPVLNLVLEVKPYDGQSYEVSLDVVMPHHVIPQFQPGASFAVKIDREDAQKIVLDVTASATA